MDLDYIKLSLDAMPMAVSIIDTRGTLVYYNRQASEWLDRKPEYIGQSIANCHKKQTSMEKTARMMDEFRQGREQPYWYEAVRYGRALRVTFTPLRSESELVGILQTVRLQDERPDESERLP